jgi:hypothetical protein
MRRATVALSIFSLLAALARPVRAQESSLTVRLRDASGAGVPRVTVVVRDAAAGRTLAMATTDERGEARFAELAASRAWVLLRGALPDGTALVQPGADAQGIAVELAAIRRLELRCERNGVVLPDPETMVALDRRPRPTPTVARSRLADIQPIAADEWLPGAADEPARADWPWLGLVLVAGLGAALGAAIVLLRRQSVTQG